MDKGYKREQNGREAKMEIHEAAEIIEAVAGSVKENPSQFHFELNITGTRATAIGGGTGLSVQAIGGGPGSKTIGFQSSMSSSSGDIEIARKTANAAIRKEMLALAEALDNLAAELRLATPNKKRITQILDSLKESWVPNTITSVVANIISKTALG
jgi:hypothetical protein